MIKHRNDLQIHITDNVSNKSDINSFKLFEKIELLKIHLKLKHNSHSVLNYINTNNLSSLFSNICIALHVYLTMLVVTEELIKNIT